MEPITEIKSYPSQIIGTLYFKMLKRYTKSYTFCMNLEQTQSSQYDERTETVDIVGSQLWAR